MRWAESLIGVSGLRISWASLCAISCHAVIRSACRSLRRDRSSSAIIPLNESTSAASSSRGRVRMRKLKSPSATRRVASSRCAMGLMILSVRRRLTRMVMKKMGSEKRKKNPTSTRRKRSRNLSSAVNTVRLCVILRTLVNRSRDTSALATAVSLRPPTSSTFESRRIVTSVLSSRCVPPAGGAERSRARWSPAKGDFLAVLPEQLHRADALVDRVHSRPCAVGGGGKLSEEGRGEGAVHE